MSLINTVTNWLTKEARQNIYLPIAHSHVKKPNYSSNPIIAGQHYFRLTLTQMSLKHERAWFAEWYPAVHSLVRLNYGEQSVEIPHIAGSQALQGIDPANLDKVIQMNHPLTNLMPFNGGDIDIFAGLLAMKGKDYIERFINILSTFSNLLTVPQLSAAINIASPLVNSVQELLGIGSGALHLGFHQLFNKASGNLRPGYIAIIRANEDQVSPDQLWIIDDHLRIGSSLDVNQSFSGYAFMLLRIDGVEERDDWQELSALQTPFQEAINAQLLGRPHEADSYLRQALVAALQSPDLTRAHRTSAALRLKEQFNEVANLGLNAVQPDFADLRKVMEGAIAPATALKLGKPDLEAMFA